MGQGGSHELPAVDAGGEWGTLATQLLQASGTAHPKQQAPLGQGWVGAHTWSTAGQEGTDGQVGSTG